MLAIACAWDTLSRTCFHQGPDRQMVALHRRLHCQRHLQPQRHRLLRLLLLHGPKPRCCHSLTAAPHLGHLTPRSLTAYPCSSSSWAGDANGEVGQQGACCAPVLCVAGEGEANLARHKVLPFHGCLLSLLLGHW